jgi:hypothetical protein
MRGDGGGMRGDGGFMRGDGGRRGGGGGADAGPLMDCPADAMNGAMCTTMGACMLPAGSAMTGVCFCRMPMGGGAATWRCVMR